MRPGVRLGVDPGRRRIGVARSDATGTLAVPVVTVTRGPGDLEQISALVAEYEAIEVVVGLPRSMSGAAGAAEEQAREFARRLAAAISVPVRLLDERMSTVQAQRSLHEAGRTTRTSKQIVDQAAAVVIVQAALDGERLTGEPPGEAVEGAP